VDVNIPLHRAQTVDRHRARELDLHREPVGVIDPVQEYAAVQVLVHGLPSGRVDLPRGGRAELLVDWVSVYRYG
jgi:hypothetical protein